MALFCGDTKPPIQRPPLVSLPLAADCSTRELANRDPALGACVPGIERACVRVWKRSRSDELCRNKYLGRAGQKGGGLRPSRCAYDKGLWRTQRKSGISGVMALVLERVPFLVQLTVFSWSQREARPLIPSDTCKRDEMTGEYPGGKDAMGEPSAIQHTK